MIDELLELREGDVQAEICISPFIEQEFISKDVKHNHPITTMAIPASYTLEQYLKELADKTNPDDWYHVDFNKIDMESLRKGDTTVRGAFAKRVGDERLRVDFCVYACYKKSTMEEGWTLTIQIKKLLPPPKLSELCTNVSLVELFTKGAD